MERLQYGSAKPTQQFGMLHLLPLRPCNEQHELLGGKETKEQQAPSSCGPGALLCTNFAAVATLNSCIIACFRCISGCIHHIAFMNWPALSSFFPECYSVRKILWQRKCTGEVFYLCMWVFSFFAFCTRNLALASQQAKLFCFVLQCDKKTPKTGLVVASLFSQTRFAKRKEYEVS